MADLLVQWHWFKKATSDTGRSEEQELNRVSESSVVFNALKHSCCLGQPPSVISKTSCVMGVYLPWAHLPLEAAEQEESSVHHTLQH